MIKVNDVVLFNPLPVDQTMKSSEISKMSDVSPPRIPEVTKLHFSDRPLSEAAPSNS
jgi:hypothetical protein